MERLTKKQVDILMRAASQDKICDVEEKRYLEAVSEVNRMAKSILTERRARRRIGFGAFLRRQVRFIYCKIWLMQACLLLLLCTALEIPVQIFAMSDTGFMARCIAYFLCCLSVLVLFSAVPFIYRSIRYTMHELELTTRFSSMRLLAARLLAIGIGNVALLLGVLFFTVIRTSLRIDNVLLYILLPYLAAACGLLYLLGHFPAEKLRIGTAGFACILFLAFLLLKHFWPAFFAQSFSFGWGTVCFILLLLCAKQAHDLMGRPAYAQMG